MKHNGARRLAELAPKIMSMFHALGRQHASGEKLPMRQLQALLILNADKRLTLSDLCEKLRLAPSTGTELANRLIDKGFVEKADESADRRKHILTLTSKGAGLLRKRQEALAERFTGLLEGFESEDREAFVKSFDTIWRILSKYHRKRESTRD